MNARSMRRAPVADHWLDLGAVARLYASSEDPDYPINQLLSPGSRGWRAAEPGEQVIEVRFDPPRDLSRLRLVFVEETATRTQQLTLVWSAHRGETHGELLRQQFNFSPAGAQREVEEYRVTLRDVGVLQLRLIPDISGGTAVASLAALQIE